MDLKKLIKAVNLKWALLITGLLAAPAFIANIFFGSIPIWAWVTLLAAALPFLYLFLVMMIIPIGIWIKNLFKKK